MKVEKTGRWSITRTCLFWLELKFWSCSMLNPREFTRNFQAKTPNPRKQKSTTTTTTNPQNNTTSNKAKQTPKGMMPHSIFLYKFMYNRGPNKTETNSEIRENIYKVNIWQWINIYSIRKIINSIANNNRNKANHSALKKATGHPGGCLNGLESLPLPCKLANLNLIPRFHWRGADS